MSYIDSIQSAVDYIEANLTQELSLHDVANQSGYSVPHFYRVFKMLAGGTVGAYVLKRRLTLAARELCSSRKTVAEVALAYGFESHDVFTRAFTRVYGLPPSRYRRCSCCGPAVERLVLGGQFSVDDSRQMRFTVVERKTLVVAGMRCSALEWDTDGAIGKLWSTFLPRVEEIEPLAIPVTMYGLCEAEPGEPGRFNYLAAIGVNGAPPKLPKGMATKTIAKQKYICADVPEAVCVPDAYMSTTAYARQNGFTIAKGDFIELYEETFRDPADHGFTLLIPIL